jgi:hypothetical protein
MYAVLVPDDGQSNRPKHVAEIQRIYSIIIRWDFVDIKKLNKLLKHINVGDGPTSGKTKIN